MLKSVEIYHVYVALNDGQTFGCVLLTPPDALLLSAVAAEEKAPCDIGRALQFAQDIEIPAAGNGAEESAITVAGTIIGTLKVLVETAYRLPQKRAPKAPAEVPGGVPGGVPGEILGEALA